MPRNLDLTALRSFVTVLEAGGVTKAAHQLHLTQSAVSMQLKRLEESLGQQLLDRSGRGVEATTQGEQLLAYGRRILELNDEVWSRMTDTAFEGEVRFGVPADIVYPHVPSILRWLDREYPRVKVKLISSYTLKLKDILAAGDADLILTTENETPAEAECIDELPLLWVGARGGVAWRQRPLRVAFERKCLFRPWALNALDVAGIPWESAVDTGSSRTVEATVTADLAVNAVLEHAMNPSMEVIAHSGALPALPSTRINMYRARTATGEPVQALAEMVRRSYRGAALAAE